MIKRLSNWLVDLVESHKAVRRSLVTFAMGLVGWTTYTLYTSLDQITPTVVSLHTITVGILSTAVGKYFMDREKEDKRRSNQNGENND